LHEATNDPQWQQIEYNFTVSKEAQEAAKKTLEEAFEKYHNARDR